MLQRIYWLLFFLCTQLNAAGLSRAMVSPYFMTSYGDIHLQGRMFFTTSVYPLVRIGASSSQHAAAQARVKSIFDQYTALGMKVYLLSSLVNVSHPEISTYIQQDQNGYYIYTYSSRDSNAWRRINNYNASDRERDVILIMDKNLQSNCADILNSPSQANVFGGRGAYFNLYGGPQSGSQFVSHVEMKSLKPVQLDILTYDTTYGSTNQRKYVNLIKITKETTCRLLPVTTWM